MAKYLGQVFVQEVGHSRERFTELCNLPYFIALFCTAWLVCWVTGASI